MTIVDRVAVERAGRVGRCRRIAGSPHAPIAAASALGLLALAELIISLALDRGSIPRPTLTASISGSTQVQAVIDMLVIALLCLSMTVPAALLKPLPAAVVVAVAGLLLLTIFETLTVAGLAAQLVAGYRLGRAALLLPALAGGLPFLPVALLGPPGARTYAVLVATLVPAAEVAGVAWHARTEAVENSANREVIAGNVLERMARGERARISRELHDVVAHHISMIAVQAETARLATPGMPAAGARRLLEIGDTARAALTEMRRLLGVLREDVPASDRERHRHPQPTLRQLTELLDQARDASGSATRLIVSGPMATLDPGVELAAYRIVQESLTNARRHAPGAAIDVELHYTDDTLRLRIRDNGPGPVSSGAGGGHGLLGMRERAAAVGGEVRTGPAAGGGFLVEASLPAKTEGH